MFRNAFAYITRKWSKSLLLLTIILLMSTLSLLGLAMRSATQEAASKSLGAITNSFSMQINRNTNPGTPRGAGNLKGEDIKKISETKGIVSTIKRINGIGDLLDYEIIETEQTLQNQSPERAKNFKSTLMLTGVNDSSKEDKFVSGAYKLVEGEHLTDKDHNQILMHEGLAKKNGLNVGDKVKLKSNLYDADNEKRADETVEVTIKGLFSGQNQAAVTYAQELYENTLITDLDTAAKLYGNTVETATYEDATFFAKGDQNIDSLIAKIQKLDINWTLYDLVRVHQTTFLQESILGMYRVANRMFIGSLIFTSLLLTLLLILWLNARRREVGIFLALGLKKTQVAGQFLMELLMIALPAFLLSYGLASFFAEKVGKTVLSNVTEGINKQMTKESLAANLGGGAEAESFSKTLTQIHMTVQPKQLLVVILVGGFILSLVSLISSRWLLQKPKDLLVDVE
ncbi:MAG: ABC transporter permease [Streptococcus salivarius]